MSACRCRGRHNNEQLEHVVGGLSRGVLQFPILVLLTPPLRLTAKLRANLSTYNFRSVRLCDGEIRMSKLILKLGALLSLMFAQLHSNRH